MTQENTYEQSSNRARHMFRNETRSCKNENLNNENVNELELKGKMRT